MALQPVQLGFGSVVSLVPQMDYGIAASSGAREACAEGVDFEGVVSPPVFALIKTPRDDESEECPVLKGIHGELGVGVMRTCESCTSSHGSDVQGAVCP